MALQTSEFHPSVPSFVGGPQFFLALPLKSSNHFLSSCAFLTACEEGKRDYPTKLFISLAQIC